MKIRKISLILAIVLMLTFMSVGSVAAENTHNISEGTVIITDACGEECPGHIITGHASQTTNNIRVLSGTHSITLKDLGVFTLQSDGSDLSESEKINFSGLYMASGTKADITLEGTVSFTCDYGIYAPGADISFNGNGDDSCFQANGKRSGIYADGANITFQNGSYYVGTDGSSGITDRNGIYAGTVTVQNAELDIQSCDVDAGAEFSTTGIYANKLIAKDSTLDITAMDAPGGTSIGIDVTELFRVENCSIEAESGEAAESFAIKAKKMLIADGTDLIAEADTATGLSVGLAATDLTLTDSDINVIAGDAKVETHGLAANDLTAVNSCITAIGGNAYNNDADYSYSDGIYASNIKGTDSEIFATGGTAVQSYGVFADTILLNGGLIQADADESSATGYGIFLNEDPFFTLIGADVIASGVTQNVCVKEEYAEGFSGIIYKADETAKPQAITNLVEFNGYFGNLYKLTYNANGVDAVMPEAETYYNGEFIEITETVPTAEGFTFLGWSEDPYAYFPEHKVGADSSTSMGNADITLYAIWQCNGGKGCILERFDDITTTAWYHDGIHFCVDTDIMEGISKTEFGPHITASRAMIVTTLYRLAGEPEVTAENTIPDVPDNKWYTDAMLWAAENGIVKGYLDGTFAPDKAATREELTAILYRCFTEGNAEDSSVSDIPDSYTDKAGVSAWAADAMAWAIDSEIIYGVTDTTLAPGSTADRAQLAAILQRVTVKIIIGEE